MNIYFFVAPMHGVSTPYPTYKPKSHAMPTPFFIIDTFTSIPFRGNPTGLIVLDQDFDATLLLSLAKELNFPVTAFISKTGSDHFSIRYFTTTTEIPACGHATLAAAQVVFELEHRTQVNFITIENIHIEVDLKDGIIWMKYPRYALEDYSPTPALLQALGVRDGLHIGICPQLESLFIEIADPATLRTLQPDFPKLIAADPALKEVVVMSCSDDPAYDFLLRSFCPWIGIDEDPVTGSVHSVLAPYWSKKQGKNSLKAFQCSPRGGEVFVLAETKAVKLGGQNRLIARGELSL